MPGYRRAVFRSRSRADIPFVQWFRQAGERAGKVRCVFADDPLKRAMIANIRLQHLKNGCLGEGFREDAFHFVPKSRHLDLMRTESLRGSMDGFVDAV